MGSQVFSESGIDHAVHNSTENTNEIQPQDLLELFSPLAVKQGWRLRRSSNYKSRQSNPPKNLDFETSDLHAGLIQAISMLKDEVIRNQTYTESSRSKMAYLELELSRCSDDLNLVLFKLHIILAVGRRPVNSNRSHGVSTVHILSDEDELKVSIGCMVGFPIMITPVFLDILGLSRITTRFL